MKKLFTAIAITSLIVSFTTSAFAQEGRGRANRSMNQPNQTHYHIIRPDADGCAEGFRRGIASGNQQNLSGIHINRRSRIGFVDAPGGSLIHSNVGSNHPNSQNIVQNGGQGSRNQRRGRGVRIFDDPFFFDVN